MTPTGLCEAVYVSWIADGRGLVTAKRVTCSPQGEDKGPYGFVRYFQKSKKFYLLIVILSERTDASRRISTAQSKRGRGVYAPNSSANVTFCAQNCNAFS